MSLMDLAGCMAASPERKATSRSKEELRREAQLYVASNFVAARLDSEEDKIATFDKGLKKLMTKHTQ